MKKTVLTLVIVLGMTLGAFAQWGGGLFQRGAVSDEEFYGPNYDYQTRTEGLLSLPLQHGTTNDEQAPLGTGTLLLIGFGAAYALKKRKKD